LSRAVDEYFIGGIKTNLGQFRRILADPEFRAGDFDTGFLDRMPEHAEMEGTKTQSDELAAIAAGIFTALGGAGLQMQDAEARVPASAAARHSTWTDVGRKEALR